MLKSYHPYAPGYAYPKNVFEDDDRRVETTKPLARRTIDAQPWFASQHPWNSGYAIPDHVKAEDAGDATWSRPLTRRTVDYLDVESQQRELPGTGGIVESLGTVGTTVAILGVAAWFMWRYK